MSLEITLDTSKFSSRYADILLVISRDKRLENTPLNGYIGFGSPRIIRHPYTREPWLCITAWKDTSGQAREIWCIPIKDEYMLELDLSRAKKIADGTDVGVTGLNSLDLLWDDNNEEWVIYSTLYPSQKNIARITTDADFNKKDAKLVSLSITPYDCGLGFVTFDDGNGIGIIMQNKMANWVVPDNPFNPTSINIDTSFNAISNYDNMYADMHKLFTIGNQLLLLSELQGYIDKWYIRLYIGPDKDWYKVGNNDMRGKYIMPVSIKQPIPHTHDYNIGNIGHPEFSTELKQPVLMWASFRNWNLKGNLAWAHEIWAWHVPPNYFNDPTRWLPAVSVINNNELGKPLFTCGAKTITVYVKTANTGTISILESSSPYHIAYDDGNYVTTTENISSAGTYKYIIENPLPYIAIKASMQIDEITIVLNK